MVILYYRQGDFSENALSEMARGLSEKIKDEVLLLPKEIEALHNFDLEVLKKIEKTIQNEIYEKENKIGGIVC